MLLGLRGSVANAAGLLPSQSGSLRGRTSFDIVLLESAVYMNMAGYLRLTMPPPEAVPCAGPSRPEGIRFEPSLLSFPEGIGDDGFD